MIRVSPGDAEAGTKPVYTLDKARTLTFTCQALKQGSIRTFQYDYVSDDKPGLLYDFLALQTEISQRVQGSNVFLMDKEEGLSDDFAHAANFAAHALWMKHRAYPKLESSFAAKSIQQAMLEKDPLGKLGDLSIDELEALLNGMTLAV